MYHVLYDEVKIELTLKNYIYRYKVSLQNRDVDFRKNPILWITRSYPVKQDLLGEIMFHWNWLTHQQSYSVKQCFSGKILLFFQLKNSWFFNVRNISHNNFLLIKIGPRRVITFPKDWLIKVILGSCPFWSLRLGRKEHIVGFINHLFFSWKWRKF